MCFGLNFDCFIMVCCRESGSSKLRSFGSQKKPCGMSSTLLHKAWSSTSVQADDNTTSKLFKAFILKGQAIAYAPHVCVYLHCQSSIFFFLTSFNYFLFYFIFLKFHLKSKKFKNVINTWLLYDKRWSCYIHSSYLPIICYITWDGQLRLCVL